MKKTLLFLLLSMFLTTVLHAQEYTQIDAEGKMTRRNEGNGNFNKHKTDTANTKKEIPIGLRAWTIDRRFGDIRPAEIDTMPHLYMNTIFNTGVYGEYNTTGNNYTARESRIFIDRPETDQFFFTQPYSWFIKQPEDFHFINTLAPYTNISYDNCGDKQHGEDHIDAKFAINAGKRLGFGFDLNYAYASGYYSNQSTSHFSGTLFSSYLGDQYQMHALISFYHEKASENGGIYDDEYITHPESKTSSFSAEEIPTVLSRNWNRNDHQHFLFSHRYNLGFYRKVKMTDEEIKARKFANAAKKEKEARERKKNGEDLDSGNAKPQGRPDDAQIAGDLPEDNRPRPEDNRITVDNKEKRDSLLALEAMKDSIDATMKDEYVPVTSFIHTLDLNNNNRIYEAFQTPEDYYAHNYYRRHDEQGFSGDSIYDKTRYFNIKNTFAIALLEGFNKYAKSGLKVFASYDIRRYNLPDTVSGQDYTTLARWNEHSVSIGGQLSKTQGKTWHYNLIAETWLAGADAGQIKIDFNTDLNFPLLGDTVQLAATAFLHRLKPTFFQKHFHSEFIWWDNDDLTSETRARIEGIFTYPKTNTQLRVAVEEVKDYMYFGMNYDIDPETFMRSNVYATLKQESGNINILTAQLRQNFRLGILNWENVLTYQNSSNKDVLPLPSFNIFSNLYLKFKVVRQLSFEIGGEVTFFSKYKAPDFCPQLNQFAIQQNESNRIELGNYPYVNVYANMHLKRARFFVMYSHVNAGGGTREYFLVPHYPQNEGVLRFGISWNFNN